MTDFSSLPPESLSLEAASPPPSEPIVSGLPQQRWQLPSPQPAQAQHLAQTTGLSLLLAQVLLNRGIGSEAQAAEFLNPETQQLPSPLDEFPDLQQSLSLLVEAIETEQKIAICGDYDADGMTSTALLIRALRFLGARVDYTIPSRMTEGYGINQRIVEDCYAEGVSLILTVDNGIAAVQPIARAQELGIAVIITDHHDIPPELPPASAILNPKLLSPTSPYRGIAGVGVAYVLAVCLAQVLNKTQDLTTPLLELFTLGTIADLAPLTGVNRRWVRRGLGLLPRSRILGIQALIQVAGLSDQDQTLKPEDIGFRLGPRINAVGRISDPQIVIDMLTTEDVGVAIERAMQCEQINTTRQDLCQQIEQEAVAWCDQAQHSGSLDLLKERVLVVVQPNWHHGVIGIVASRLVERYGVPVFIGTFEDGDQKTIRGSARGVPEFDVFEALQSCDDLLAKYGGHRAAGGFSFPAKHLRQVKSRLANYARSCLQIEDLKPLVQVDVRASLGDINRDLYQQIDALHPCGIENPDPVFWTPAVRVLEQRTVGRDQSHLKLTVAEGDITMKAIAWRWGEYYPLPEQIDIAYKLKLNQWQGQSNVELELVGVRLPVASDPNSRDPNPVVIQPDQTPDQTPDQSGHGLGQRSDSPASSPVPSTTRATSDPPPIPAAQANLKGEGPEPEFNRHLAPTQATSPARSSTQPLPLRAQDLAQEYDTDQPIEFLYSKRPYWASITTVNGHRQLAINNSEGHQLLVQLTERQGYLQLPGAAVKPVDISADFYFNLVRAGLNALELQQKTRLLLEQDELLANQDKLLATKDHQIEALTGQVARLEAQLTQATQALSPVLEQSSPELAPSKPSLQAQILPTSPPSPGLDPEQSAIDPLVMRQQVRQMVGDQVWFCLTQPTQIDLCQAVQHQTILADQGFEDYSAPALRLGAAIDRDILQPFLTDFNRYAQGSDLSGLAALAQIDSPAQQQQLLPVLVSKTWTALIDQVLTARSVAPDGSLYRTIRATSRAKAIGIKVDNATQKATVQFLEAWDHPVAGWLIGHSKEAAAALDQCRQLVDLAAQPEVTMAAWQYDLLQGLVLGTQQGPGLLAQVFGH